MLTRKQTGKINVVVATDHAGYAGKLAGVGRYLQNTLPALDPEKFQITLVVFRELANLDVLLADSNIRIIHLKRTKFNPLILFDFITIIRKERADLIHVHQYASANFGRLASLIMGVPLALHIHGPDIYYPWYQRLADRLFSRVAGCVLAVSTLTAKECTQNRSIKAEDITVLPNGVPLTLFKRILPEASLLARKQWRVPIGCLVVGTITRLHEVKGNAFLLQAASLITEEFSDVRFVIVGDGPLKEQLEWQVAELGISNKVIFTGYQSDVVSLLSLFDVAVLPSLQEGHPQALLEAMAAGIAIVATEVGGVRDTIIDNQEGFLVPPGDARALAEKVTELLEDPRKRARFGRAALKRSRDFSQASHVRRLEIIYQQLAMSRR